MNRFLMYMSILNRKIDEYVRGVPSRPEDDFNPVMKATAVGEYNGDALKALDEWHAAENYFNSINDPDLVEYALYELEAARRKYEYLMRKIRNEDAALVRRGI